VIELELPIEPRLVYANEKAANLTGMTAVASGPIVYGLEGLDNQNLNVCNIDIESPLIISFEKDMLNGVNVIRGKAAIGDGARSGFIAVPFFAINNRMPGNAFKVWMPVLK